MDSCVASIARLRSRSTSKTSLSRSSSKACKLACISANLLRIWQACSASRCASSLAWASPCSACSKRWPKSDKASCCSRKSWHQRASWARNGSSSARSCKACASAAAKASFKRSALWRNSACSSCCSALSAQHTGGKGGNGQGTVPATLVAPGVGAGADPIAAALAELETGGVPPAKRAKTGAAAYDAGGYDAAGWEVAGGVGAADEEWGDSALDQLLHE
mmetsp:Transcript_18092/g.52261  ORF Transcript_18092/g.52261 Transcript_18092/m.52261 type:complete len:220 (-) Transcript_18092:91-750(-)